MVPITIHAQTQLENLNLDELNNIGLELLQQGKYEEAIRYFDQVLKVESNNISALSNKGAAYSQTGNYEEALKFFNKALEVNSSDVDVLSNKGAALFNLGKIDESKFVIEQILEIEPNNIKILLIKADMLRSIEKYYDASQVYEKILEIDTENTFAQDMLNQELDSTELISMKSSKYFGYVQIEVRNSNGNLVSVTESDTLDYLPFAITDEFLNEIKVDNIVSMNDKNYEIYKLKETLHAEEDTFIGRVTLGDDKIGYDIKVFSSFPNGFTVEYGDVVIAHWTILREVT